MSLKLLCLIITIVQIISVNYQDRGIYYNEEDNVCHVALDLILLRYNIDGQKTVTHTTWGETSCRVRGDLLLENRLAFGEIWGH